MAIVKTEDIALQARGFNGLSLLRQLGLMIGLAASVAVGVAAVLWSQGPSYRLLYSNLSEQDAGAISASLDSAGIQYKLSEDSGTIMVVSDQVHGARLKLATQGLPKGSGAGFELLEKDGGFGVSQFMENARYHRALEGELARTISSIQGVQSARVHLAIPKQTAFVRDQKKPTASVTINLLPGRSIEGEEVAAIAHMVAASIPNLDVDQVTVIDQRGRLLTSPGSSNDMRLSSTQFEYRKHLEEHYMKRIEDILTPIAGMGGVKAQVSADIDFTVTEQTQESFNPDLPAIRSEQTVEEQSSGSQLAGGVPGSLSNQPPGVAGQESAQESPGSSTRRATRNYELDKTISHVRVGGGFIKRLSVAVVVDDKQETDEDGEVTRTPLTKEELVRFTNLVKEAIGFNTQRGDSVNVINAAFSVPPVPEPLPEPSFFDSPMVWNVLKQLLAGGFVIFIVLGVLRPVLRELVAKGKLIPVPEMYPGGLAQDQFSRSGPPGQLQGAAYENNLNTARSLVSQDPKRVAQVVNNWVSGDA